MKKYLLIGIGCAFGAMVRNYVIDAIGAYTFGLWAVIVCNVVGCFFIGMIMAALLKRWGGQYMYAFFATGFCGGLTTFSEYAGGLANAMLIHDIWISMGFLLIEFTVCIAAVYYGMWIFLSDKKIIELLK